ncbi:hypothetical protein [Burkholderia pyrrocinia]|uniref:hypothetical protein n=1 Tax=Burkholderia pyrrocinia TaxID=60550 RepID=UPI00158CB4EB|nr:hypothetical protein [Burkholderia pyrrocinia]
MDIPLDGAFVLTELSTWEAELAPEYVRECKRTVRHVIRSAFGELSAPLGP